MSVMILWMLSSLGIGAIQSLTTSYAHCPPQFVRQQLLAPTERIKLLAFGQAQTDQPGKWAVS